MVKYIAEFTNENRNQVKSVECIIR